MIDICTTTCFFPVLAELDHWVPKQRANIIHISGRDVLCLGVPAGGTSLSLSLSSCFQFFFRFSYLRHFLVAIAVIESSSLLIFASPVLCSIFQPS